MPCRAETGLLGLEPAWSPKQLDPVMARLSTSAYSSSSRSTRPSTCSRPVGPKDHHFVGTPITDVAQRRQKNHQIDRAVLGRHHAEISDDRVLRAADGLRLRSEERRVGK